MKPTIRVSHGVMYRAGDATRPISEVAIKQLYASDYFHTALDVSIGVADTKPQRRGFCLVTLKSSEQDDLTGVKGSILRKVVVGKTRSSLEKGLALIKAAVERNQWPPITAALQPQESECDDYAARAQKASVRSMI